MHVLENRKMAPLDWIWSWSDLGELDEKRREMVWLAPVEASRNLTAARSWTPREIAGRTSVRAGLFDCRCSGTGAARASSKKIGSWVELVGVYIDV